MNRDKSVSHVRTGYEALKEKGWPLGFVVLIICVYLVVSDVVSEDGVGIELGCVVPVGESAA